MRTAFDFSPFYRTAIGFDRVFDMLEGLARAEPDGYPPYNVERIGDDSYRVTLAVAGFGPDEINITAQPNQLVVTGRRNGEDRAEVLHRGLALRPFERRFSLADHIEVRDARLENGLLTIELVRNVPEALKPRRIAINGPASGPALEHKPGMAEGAMVQNNEERRVAA